MGFYTSPCTILSAMTIIDVYGTDTNTCIHIYIFVFCIQKIWSSVLNEKYNPSLRHVFLVFNSDLFNLRGCLRFTQGFYFYYILLIFKFLTLWRVLAGKPRNTRKILERKNSIFFSFWCEHIRESEQWFLVTHRLYELIKLTTYEVATVLDSDWS